MEEQWATQLRSFLSGKGIPTLAGWGPKPGDTDLDDMAARATLLLQAASATSLMPVNPDWRIEVISTIPCEPDDAHALTGLVQG